MPQKYLRPEQFLKQISEWEKLTWKNINTLIKQISYDVFQDVILNTPVDSGLARNQWVFSEGSAPQGKAVNMSKTRGSYGKSGKDAIKKVYNGLKRAPVMIKDKGTGVRMYFLTNGAPYINKLEYRGYVDAEGKPANGPKTIDGASKQAPGGMANLAVQKASKQGVSKYSRIMQAAARNNRSLQLGQTKYSS